VTPTRTPIKTLDVRTRARWRAWLEKHHASVAEIWLAFHKQHTGRTTLDHEASVEEALCSYRRAYVGWIDAAKREETKERRLREAVARLKNGEKLGLK
jgi:uncharacterized protein YdeI (YjbR/CyaY-like superfamily)